MYCISILFIILVLSILYLKYNQQQKYLKKKLKKENFIVEKDISKVISNKY